MACPWANVLYAMDRPWWQKYIADVQKQFGGLLYAPLKSCFNVRYAPVRHYQNSGAGVIALAAWLGVKNVYLLGYDMQYTGGKKHWHGDHPKGLANAGKIAEWPRQFLMLKRDLPQLKIINCTRETALKCFDRVPLEQALCD